MIVIFRFIAVSVIFAMSAALGQETRSNSHPLLVELTELPPGIFVTDRDSVALGTNGPCAVRKSVEEALKSPDCKSAEKDSEGNWGRAVDGWQVSLRFPKLTYSVGEPIEGVVLLRNVSKDSMRYPLSLSGGFPITWRRKEDNLSSRQEIRDPEGLISSMGPTVYARTQREFHVRFEQVLSTNAPGTFAVSVRTRVPKISPEGMSEVSSGDATIRITPSAEEK